MINCKAVCGSVLIFVGCLLFILGIMMGPWLSSWLDNRFQNAGEGYCDAESLKEEKFLQPYSDCESCTSLYYNYHVFHVDNVEDFLADPVNTKPVLKEMGPYVYRNEEVRVNATYDDGFVTLSQYDKWAFQADQSSGKEDDKITKQDLGYLAITTGAGGEENFVDELIAAVLTLKGLPVAFVNLVPEAVLTPFKANMMKLLNGLNSLDPVTMATAVGKLSVLLAPDADIQAAIPQLAFDTEIQGFHYNGVFVTRTIREWFYGYPSFTAGLAIGAGYPKCLAPGEHTGEQTLFEFCDSCVGEECHLHWSDCSGCRRARAVKAKSDAICDDVEEMLAASPLGAATAAQVVGGTCRLCGSASLFCLAMLPGEIESSGKDYHQEEPDLSTLDVYKVDQGCTDTVTNGEYALYEGVATQPVWRELAEGQTMPGFLDLNAFGKTSWCDSDVQEEITCQTYIGNDGKTFRPAGVQIAGLDKDLAFEEHAVFVTQALLNISVVPSGEEIEVKGIELKRLRPPADALKRVPWNDKIGVGFPVDGVVNLAFQSGFLSFLARPMFLYADKSLREDIRLITKKGVELTKDTPDSELVDDYDTFVDVEPATGVAMNARKRLMASVALATEFDLENPTSTASTSNLVHPTMKAHRLMPSFWVDESATISDTRAEKFKDVVELSKVMAPLLGVGVGLAVVCWVVGTLLLIAGCKSSPATSADAETGSQPSQSSVEQAKLAAGNMPAHLAMVQQPGQAQRPSLTEPMAMPGRPSISQVPVVQPNPQSPQYAAPQYALYPQAA